ncbi:hypothetical protein MMC14_004235 [Varicellaria rhodocarpa]|nr:hypothetical protein [Varicellaria rhodocarpa]
MTNEAGSLSQYEQPGCQTVAIFSLSLCVKPPNIAHLIRHPIAGAFPCHLTHIAVPRGEDDLLSLKFLVIRESEAVGIDTLDLVALNLHRSGDILSEAGSIDTIVK